MSKSLASVANGRVVFGEAVSHIAESLNPLGAASRIIAETYALTTEMRRINLEKTQTADDKELALAVLDQRRRESSATLRRKQEELGHAEISAQQLRECMVRMQRATIKPGLSPEALSAYVELTKDFTAQLVQHHKDQAGESTISLDRLLNGPSATALAASVRRPTREPKPAAREDAGSQSAAPKTAKPKPKAKSKAKSEAKAKAKPEPQDDGRARGRRR